MSKVRSNVPTPEHTMRGALSRIRAEIDSLGDGELIRPNVDLITTIIKVRAVLPGLLALRAQVLEELPHFDIRNLDRLDLYTLALSEAQSFCLSLILPNKEPAALAKEAITLRSQLSLDAKVLVRRGFIPRERLQKLRGTHGYRNLANDLLLLAALFRAHWQRISGRCSTSAAELDRAEALGHELTKSTSHRRAPLEEQTAATEDRRRAFTLFFRAYTEVRRAVQYLRFHEGDADCLAPALSGKHKGPSRRARPKPEAIDTSVSTVPVDAPVADAVAPQAVTRRVGLPGSDPFLH